MASAHASDNHGADFGFGDDLAGDFGLAAIPPHGLAPGDLGHVIFDGVARHHRLAEFRLVDGQEKHRLRLRSTTIAAMQSTPAVCAMPSIISTPGKHRIAGKVPLELRLVER